MSGAALFGREAALAAVRELLDDACEGRPALALVTGEWGVGRTSLLRAVVEKDAVGRFQVAFARGCATGRTLPFGVAGELLAGLLAQEDDPTRASLSAIGDGAVRRMIDGVHCGIVETDPTDLATTLWALRQLCREITVRTPLLVVVDDVRLADPPSQRWLADIASWGIGVAVLLADSTLPSPAGCDLLPEIAAAPRIRLDGLDESQLRQFVQHAFGVDLTAEQRQALVAATGGVPLLVREVLRDLVERQAEITTDTIRAAAPRTVAGDLRARLATCDPALSVLVRAVAILRDNSVLPKLSRLSGRELPELLSAADTLASAGVLGNSQPLAFARPVVGNALREHLPIGDLIAGHLSAARLLYEAGGAVWQIADHLMAAGPFDLSWATDILRAAARRERAKGRPKRAVAYLTQAVREPLPASLRPSVLRELGEAELLVTPADALRHLTEARRLTTDGHARAELALLIADALTDLGRDDDALASLANAMTDAGREDDAETIAGNGKAAAGLRLAHADIALRAVPAEEPAVPEHEPAAPDEPGWAALSAIRSTLRGEHVSMVVPPARRMVRSALNGGAPPAGYWHAVRVLTFADELQTAAECALQGHEAAVRAGWPRHIATALRCRALVRTRQGDLAGATELLTESVELSRRHGIEASFGNRIGVAQLAEVLVLRGLTVAALDLLRTVDPPGPPHHCGSAYLLHAGGVARCAAGDVRAGVANLQRAGRLWHAFGVVNPAAAPWRRTAVRALLILAEPASATALAEEDLAAARRWGATREIGVAVHTKALCLAGQERLDLLRTAVGALERLPGRVELADALVDLGIARQEVGRRSDQARSCLVRGMRLARGAGAAAVRGRATAALARIDAADSDASSVGTGGDVTAAGHTLLTPQEARVAALALRGRTNREIAAELELSQRTVEFHLSGVYRKFGISGRRQLVEITKLP